MLSSLSQWLIRYQQFLLARSTDTTARSGCLWSRLQRLHTIVLVVGHALSQGALKQRPDCETSQSLLVATSNTAPLRGGE
jgi:hypothetical protein